MHGNHPQRLGTHTAAPEPPPQPVWSSVRQLTTENRQPRKGWTTWWSSRGARTRSHPELGRENPQRPWYCVSRHGRVGRRQVLQPFLSTNPTKTNQTPTHQTNHPDHGLPHNAETNASD